MLKKIIFMCLAMFSFSWAMALVNINTASKEELKTLHRIGDKKAADIIEYRTRHGAFKTVDELTNVPRIGVKTLEGLRPYITVGEPVPEKNKTKKIAVPATDHLKP